MIPPADTGLGISTRGRSSKATSSTSRNMSIIDGEYTAIVYTFQPREAEGASFVTALPAVRSHPGDGVKYSLETDILGLEMSLACVQP